MSCGEAFVCGTKGMSGCGGRLCMACRAALKRYRLLRYPCGSDGAPDLSQQPEEFMLCGFTASAAKARTDGKLEIPGNAGGGRQGIRMTVAAASCEMTKGDRVIVDGAVYRIAVVHSGVPAVAVMVAA